MQLSKLGVTVCEAGFPIASEGDFEAVSRIAREVGGMTEVSEGCCRRWWWRLSDIARKEGSRAGMRAGG